MRPIRVEFQAFGPYADHETVDFEALAGKGLFLICPMLQEMLAEIRGTEADGT